MQPSFQNGAYYTPGSSVLTYFIISGLSSVVGTFGLLAIAWYLVHTFAVPALGSFLPLKVFDAYYGTGYEVIGVLALIGCVFSLISSAINYYSIRFMFDEFAFHIEKGILSKSEISIPYRQIQNVNHDQTFGERTWGMVRVIVETAGTDDKGINGESDGVMPLMDASLAATVENELMRRSSPAQASAAVSSVTG